MELSGCGEEAANEIVLALENDVASGSGAPLTANGVSSEAVRRHFDRVYRHALDAGAARRGCRKLAVVLNGVEAGAFNADEAAKLQFKKAIVAAVDDVVSTDMVTNVVAKEAARRRLATSGLDLGYRRIHAHDHQDRHRRAGLRRGLRKGLPRLGHYVARHGHGGRLLPRDPPGRAVVRHGYGGCWRHLYLSQGRAIEAEPVEDEEDQKESPTATPSRRPRGCRLSQPSSPAPRC